VNTVSSTLPTIKPMLASPPKAERIEQLKGTHAFDTKIDGIRAVLYWDGSVCYITNRSGKHIAHRFPEVEAAATNLPGPCVLDGEIVAVSGSFQDTARRDKQTQPGDVARWMHEIPVVFVAFDVLWKDTDLRPMPFDWRRQQLELMSLQGPVLTTSVLSLDPAFFDQVKALGMEGVIAKRLRSTYRAGRFSDWLKFKTVRSITAVGIGYEKGTGARAHFGAMFLALIDDDGKPVEIGRVGTGFTASEITDLKAMMDAGQPVLCEIECLNKSKDGKLRFPVYKGLRGSELSLADATLSQLDDIPTM
jgi:bifunctional non-homologous end joining protein LigD